MTSTATLGQWRNGGTAAAPWLAAGALVLAVGLGAFFVHPLLGAAVLGLFAAPLFVVAPQYAFLLFVALLPFDAVSSLQSEGGVTITRLIGLALFAGWILHLVIERKRVRLTRGARRLCVFVAFAGVSVLWAGDPSVSLRAVITLVQLLLLAVMGSNVLREPRDVQRVVDVLLASTAIVAVLMLGEVNPAGHRLTFTFGGETVNANYVAATLVFPAVAAVALGSAGGAWGWWRFAAVAPIAIALFLTGSRGGAVALIGGLLVVAAVRRRVGVRLAIGGVLLATVLPLMVPQATMDKLTSRYSAAEEDRLSGRMDIWRVAMAMVEDRPLQGQAYGGFADAFYQYMLTAKVDPEFGRMHSRGNRAAHNIYLGTLAELGIVGIVLLGAALLAHWRGLWRARLAALRRGDETTARLALALLGVFASVLIFGATIDLLGTKATWIWLATMEAVTFIAVRRSAGTPAPVRAPSRRRVRVRP